MSPSSQREHNPEVMQTNTDYRKPYRTLSIDGGGLKGVMPAAFLAEIERVTGCRVVDHFDLVVGTSTGGIIALGIGLGLPCSQILEFYREKGPEVFGHSGGRVRIGFRRVGRWIKQLFANKHPSESLRMALYGVFGERVLGESQTRLVIPAWDSLQRHPRLFKTAHHQRFELDYQESVVNIAMATAAAPTYFPAYQPEGGLELVDGGVWANNPSTVAAVEATAVLRWPAESVFLLSLGCTDERLIVPKRMGRGRGALMAVDMLMQAQSLGADVTARMLLGGGGGERDPVHRVDVTVDRNFAKLDTTKNLSKLEGLGKDRARQLLPILRKEFFKSPKREFIPFHKLEQKST